MSVVYSTSSPYYGTGLFGAKFLDLMDYRAITKNANDPKYIIDKVYDLKPHLLASDLYGDSKLWWVFAARNPDVLKDPLFDFTAGTTIYLPTKNNLVTDLGL